MRNLKPLLRRAWRWCESLRWEEVKFALAKLVLVGVMICLIYIGMGIGCYYAAAKATDQLRRCGRGMSDGAAR